MFLLFLTAANCESWIEKPEIQIRTPTISDVSHVARKFKNLKLAKPYIQQCLKNAQASDAILKKLDFVTNYGTDVNTMGGGTGADFAERTFSRTHTILYVSKNNGTVSVNFGKVDINCNVHAEQTMITKTTKKKLFGLIKKTKKSQVKQYRNLNAAELTRIYNTMNDAAKNKLQTTIQKVKAL